jgi:hypothetical protein
MARSAIESSLLESRQIQAEDPALGRRAASGRRALADVEQARSRRC